MACKKPVGRFEPSRGPWGGKPPSREKLISLPDNRFGIVGRLASGQMVTVPLGRVTFESGQP